MNDWRHLTFAKALERIVPSYGDNEGLVYHDERLTYLEFQKRVDRLSKGLIALGVCDGENHYCFKGRMKEMYKSHGFNVTPREVEEFLQAHPKVQAVGVVGVPHPETGETGMAFIELVPGAKATVQDMLEYCRGKIASYKIPKFIIFLDSLPRIQAPIIGISPTRTGPPGRK